MEDGMDDVVVNEVSLTDINYTQLSSIMWGFRIMAHVLIHTRLWSA